MPEQGLDGSAAVKSVDALSWASTDCGTSSVDSNDLDLGLSVTNEDADDVRSESKMMQWTIQLQRKKGRIGMQVTETMQGTRAVILGVHVGGQIAQWNARHPDKRVRPGDMLLQVNDVTSGARCLTEEIMRETRTLTLRLARYVSFPLHISNRAAGERLGVVEDHLTVIEVVRGSLMDLHCSYDVTPPEFWLRPGDRIIACNGYESERDIRSELHQAQQIEMIVQRTTPKSSTETKGSSPGGSRGPSVPAMQRARGEALNLMKFVGGKLGAQKLHKQRVVVQDALLDDF